jgi:transcriptional regulator with XRE-family HTH domain
MEPYKDKELLQKIALRLKQLRHEHNVSQGILYFDTGINIGRIERAQSNLSISTLKKLCRYFGITLKDFFEGID